MNDDVEDHLRKVGARLRLPETDKKQVLRELRAHIQEKIEDLRSAGRDQASATRTALADLGAPEELAVAYNGSRTQVRDRRGEVAVDVVRAVGRGTAKAIKWVAIAVAFLLVLGSVVAYVAFQEAKPTLAREYRREVYAESTECGSIGSCGSTLASDTFDAPADAHTLEFMFTGIVETGTLRIEVKDASGKVVLDKPYTRTTQDRPFSGEVQWNAQDGPWSLSVTSTAFAGSFTVQATAVGVSSL